MIIGNTVPTAIKVGNTNVDKIYVGNTLIYPTAKKKGVIERDVKR